MQIAKRLQLVTTSATSIPDGKAGLGHGLDCPLCLLITIRSVRGLGISWLHTIPHLKDFLFADCWPIVLSVYTIVYLLDFTKYDCYTFL